MPRGTPHPPLTGQVKPCQDCRRGPPLLDGWGGRGRTGGCGICKPAGLALPVPGLLITPSPSGGPGGQLPQKAQIHGGILRLPAVEPSDQAQYLCRARNSAGQHVARAVLHVHGEGTGLRAELGSTRTVQRAIFTGFCAQGAAGPGSR